MYFITNKRVINRYDNNKIKDNQSLEMKKGLSLGLIAALSKKSSDESEITHQWSYRDDVGAHWGIKGYEEMVSEVGTEHGHMTWP